LLTTCIAVATLLGSLALGSNTAPSDASRPGNDAPASVFAAAPGEPARIPALEEGPAGFSAGPDRPLDQQLSGEAAGGGGLTVDVRRALEQIASEG
jgi:hypothetical protein